MGYIVELEVFHGPLDLLLFLIEKDEVDIYDIPIANITSQYMDYIQDLSSINIEQLGDFLILASYLLNIKSKMLLPKHDLETLEIENTDDEDPRDDLVKRLLEYKKIKEAAKYLAARQAETPQTFLRNSSFAPEIHEVLVADIQNLVGAYKEILKRLDSTPEDFPIPTGDISISEKMQELLKMLYNKPKGLVFQNIFTEVTSKREALAFFLALLELIRLQKVWAVQNNINNTININLVGEYKNDDEK